MTDDVPSYEELRAITLDVLKDTKQTQTLSILHDVEQLALKRGFYKDQPTYSFGGSDDHKMPVNERENVRLIINEFLIEGILSWGINEHNPNPPFLKVTRYGEECLKHGMPQPYDPDGYLKYLKSEIPTLDDIIFTYMAESLNAYLKGLPFSSTVMLGCASEKAFLILSDSFINSISDPAKKQTIENNIKGKFSVKRQFDEFRKYFTQIKPQLPRSISDDIEIQLDGVFNFIRNCRNDVGHPTGRAIDKSLAFNNLRLFVPYCKKIYEVIDFFNSNKITI